VKVKSNPIICGLDVGTTKICMMVARRDRDGGLELISSGYAESAGLVKGAVVNLDEIAASIRKAASEAEMKCGMPVDCVKVGVGGDHFQSYNSRGAVTIAGERQEVTDQAVDQVVLASRASVALPPDREIVHVLPQEFFLDGRGDIQNPVGLFGSQLDVDVHIVTCQKALCLNLINAVNRAEIRVRKVVFKALASAEAVLTKDEKELGVVLVEIGGGGTDIVVVRQNAVRFTKVLPVGGVSFTRDLAFGLQTPVEEAERIKKESGTVLTERLSDGDEPVQVLGTGAREPREVSRRVVCEILRARAMETLEIVADEIRKAEDAGPLVAGAVVSGGGSMLDGMVELAADVLDMPARQGLPRKVKGMKDDLIHPGYATAVGLTMFTMGAAPRAPSPPGFLARVLAWVGA
jgi:cell division protein FtsA